MLASSRWFPTRLTQPNKPRGNRSFVPGQMYKSELMELRVVSAGTIGQATNYGIVSVSPAPPAQKNGPSFPPKLGPLRCEDRMKLTHRFAEMTPEKRPQDPHMDDCPALRNIGPPAGNIPTQCPKTSTDQCRRPLLHLRADHAGRQGGRQPRVRV
jgi:hypothetical protein